MRGSLKVLYKIMVADIYPKSEERERQVLKHKIRTLRLKLAEIGD